MRALLLAFVLTVAARAADLSGIWIGQIPGRNGEPQDIAFQFTQKGAALGGKLYGDYRSTVILEGKVTGDSVEFVLLAPEQAGNQINETRLRFMGELKNGELELSRTRESSKNAGNSGGAQTRGDAKVSFKLRRLI
jgi:hypothetical protein